MPTIQDLDRAAAAHLAAARDTLVLALTAAARGHSWHYLLFGSLARGTARRGSDADIAIVGASRADRWAAERAAFSACDALAITADVMEWDDLAPFVQSEALRDGIRCGA